MYLIQGVMKDGSKVLLGTDTQKERADERASRLDAQCEAKRNAFHFEMPTAVVVAEKAKHLQEDAKEQIPTSVEVQEVEDDEATNGSSFEEEATKGSLYEEQSDEERGI